MAENTLAEKRRWIARNWGRKFQKNPLERKMVAKFVKMDKAC